MTIAEAIRWAAPLLQPTHITCSTDRDLGIFEAQLLLASILKQERIFLLAHPEKPLSSAQLQRFKKYVLRRKKHEPIAYILGKKEFYGRSFSVTKHTLIPRPETELLIEEILAGHANAPFPRPLVIWDVGTGSGAIANTLALELPHASILATDIRLRTLAIAKKNAKRLHAKPQPTFLKQDLLQAKAYQWVKKSAAREQAGLIIVANLPYLPLGDKKRLAPDVTAYEPDTALYSGKDGLDLILRFLGQLGRHIHEWGYAQKTIYLEYDPPQTQKLRQHIQRIFPQATISIKKDLAGHNRICKVLL